VFRRLFGPPEVKLEAGQPAPPPTPPGGSAAETATVRQIVERLEALPPDQARLIATVSYVVTRAAYADFHFSDEETRFLEDALQQFAGLDESQTVLIIEMAKLSTRAVGETEDFLVTREFRSMATYDQCLRVLRACFLVVSADDTISAAESATVNQIANELGIEDADLQAMRGEFTEKYSAIQAARKAAAGGPAPA
jgi:uncharacterized tellurite resistance protein B-like protein